MDDLHGHLATGDVGVLLIEPAECEVPVATLPYPEDPVPPTSQGSGDGGPTRPADSQVGGTPSRKDAEGSPGAQHVIRILLVDDHAAIRQALAFALKAEADIEVIGEAGNGRVAMEKIRQLMPEVVLMDINLPGENGIEVTRRIRAEFPRVQVIGFSMYESGEQAKAMREAGAAGYVSKTASYAALLEAIRSVRSRG